MKKEKVRVHNEYFRTVETKTLYEERHRPEWLIQEILGRPGNTLTEEFLKKPYTTIVGYASRRKSCSSCKSKLNPGEYIWSWGEYVNGKWRTVGRFCKHCFPSVKKQLLAHRDSCGCSFELIGYRGEKLPTWLCLDDGVETSNPSRCLP